MLGSFESQVPRFTARLRATRRDAQGRAYKPLLLLCALRMLAARPRRPLPLRSLLELFDEELATARRTAGVTGRTGVGHQPAWHLSTTVHGREGLLVLGPDRVAEGRPRPRSDAALLEMASEAAVLPDVADELATTDGIEAARLAVLDLLSTDPDSTCQGVLQAEGIVADLIDETADLLRASNDAFQLDRPDPASTTTRVQRWVRDRALRSLAAEAYDDACAACSKRLRQGLLSEVECAHVKPHALGGCDDLRNVVALCRTHHWAFDRRLWTLTADRRIQVCRHAVADSDDLRALLQLDGAALRPPKDPRHAVHGIAIQWHRDQFAARCDAHGA